MNQRRILVIGSQCKALQPLSFLPDAAQALYAVMTDTERGACVPALEGTGLLLDPTVATAKDAIRTAYQRAAKDGASLFIAYIGHGEHVKNNFQCDVGNVWPAICRCLIASSSARWPWCGS